MLKAEHLTDGKFKYFVDKCLLFGASISCSLYQKFSDTLKDLLECRTKQYNSKAVTNYLDDFVFAAITQWLCNLMIEQFIKLCDYLGVPVAIEKTEWVNTIVVFLGILLKGETLILSIPLDKQMKALNMLNLLLSKRKTTVKQLQVLTSYLNFLTKAVVPGRMFTRHLYSKIAAKEVTSNISIM